MKRLLTWFLISFLAFSTLSSTPVSAQAPSSSAAATSEQSAMTVADVLNMLQVKLGEDLIVTQIRKNGKPFSLLTDDIVRLKTAGASDNVIRVMLNPMAEASSPTSVPASASAPPLPSAYGYYVLDGSNLSSLEVTSVK